MSYDVQQFAKFAWAPTAVRSGEMTGSENDVWSPSFGTVIVRPSDVTMTIWPVESIEADVYLSILRVLRWGV